MWLIDVETMGLKWFMGNEWTPPYAILSHLWGPDESLFHDFVRETGRHKMGSQKILRCCQLAKRDSLNWLWVDTCCINKESSAELSETINTMFQWYEKAAVCYTYLPDVLDIYETSNEDKFTDSRWFRRGWTLQELIAPQEVHFYDESWKYIASRSALADQIAKVTNVDVALLQERRGQVSSMLSNYSVAQRLSWAANRETTREEDQAYSLLGIFGIKEIMRSTADLSILAWSPTPGSIAERAQQPLACSLADFAKGGKLIPTQQPTGAAWYSETTLTNAALRITTSVREVPNPGTTEKQLVAILGC
ncbi:Uu.00g128320.m01.CDS01 [Anthostomella pinea]|uniref:Uu.00g128320.m01.CDS01 n=1 Tax=Anthostomella pinea TaxID=933095 RepID=A0AAI8VI81_9PEZI|nr:Uu.00g128320.m01.CDS01 [Anthostomella pinea]